MPTIRALSDLEGEPHAIAFPDAEPRTVRLTLAAGESVPEHDHPDREIVCFVRSGTLALELDGVAHELSAGDVARFDGDQSISPTAVTDCTALLVLAPRAAD